MKTFYIEVSAVYEVAAETPEEAVSKMKASGVTAPGFDALVYKTASRKGEPLHVDKL